MTRSKKIKALLAVSFLGVAVSYTSLQFNKNAQPLPDKEDIIAARINSALKILDPHSGYLTPQQFKVMQQKEHGAFVGIGATLNMDTGYLGITETIEGSPAAHAGLRPGDIITHINTRPTQGMPLHEAVALIRGKQKSSVNLTIKRPDSAAFHINIPRAAIRLPAVSSKIISNDIGYIRINNFINHTVDTDLSDAVKQLQQNNPIHGYILDLRNNPGGYLHMANAVADAFIDSSQLILTVKGREESDIRLYHATPGDITNAKPLIVLIDGGSASAAEIVAGALQDTKRAIIIGTQSYGKGSVQQIIPLEAGGALRITMARYYTAGGHSIEKNGITPDITTRLENHSAMDDFTLASAVETLRKIAPATVTSPATAPSP